MEPTDGQAPRGATRRSLRALLAERSRRGRLASYAVAAVAVAAALVLLFALFPRRDPPTGEVRIGGRGARVAQGDRLVVWPGNRLRVSGERASAGAVVSVLLGGRSVGALRVAADGSYRGTTAVPAGTTPGTYGLVLRDGGSGRAIRTVSVEVRDPGRPGLAVQPAEAAAGDEVAFTAGGLPADRPVAVVLDPGPGATALLRPRARHSGLLVGTLRVPPDTPAGDHVVALLGPDGVTLGEAATLRVSS